MRSLPEWQANFTKLVQNIDLRNQLYRDAKALEHEAPEEALALLGLAEAAHREAVRIEEELLK